MIKMRLMSHCSHYHYRMSLKTELFCVVGKIVCQANRNELSENYECESSKIELHTLCQKPSSV